MKMTLNLDLNYTLPEELTLHPYILRNQNSKYFTLASGDGKFWILEATSESKEVASFSCDAGYGLVTLHPDAKRYAFWKDKGISIRKVKNNSEILYKSCNLGGCKPLQIQYDLSGKYIWLTSEGIDGNCILYLLDANNLDIYDSVDVGGDKLASSNIILRPNSYDVLVEISFGQEGSSITAVSVNGWSLSALAIRDYNDPHGVIGFDSDGKTFFAICDNEFKRLNWPDSREVGSIEIPEPIDTCWQGVNQRDRVFVVGHHSDETNDEYWPEVLEINMKDLKIISRYRVPDYSNVYITQLKWLGENLVVTLDQQFLPIKRRARIWNFEP